MSQTNSGTPGCPGSAVTASEDNRLGVRYMWPSRLSRTVHCNLESRRAVAANGSEKGHWAVYEPPEACCNDRDCLAGAGCQPPRTAVPVPVPVSVPCRCCWRPRRSTSWGRGALVDLSDGGGQKMRKAHQGDSWPWRQLDRHSGFKPGGGSFVVARAADKNKGRGRTEYGVGTTRVDEDVQG